MSYVVGSLFLVTGLISIFKPDFFYQSNRLNEDQIARNKRIWKRVGIVLVIFGVADVILTGLGSAGVIK